MNAQAKKTTGFVLVSISLVATAAWAYTSFRARELVGSPFVWVTFLVAYFWGVVLIPSSESEADESTKKSLRKRLVLVFLGMSLAIGAVFILAHVLLGDATRSSQSYAPWSVVTALLAYAWYHHYWGRRAGMGGVLAPITFFIGIVFAPVMFIEIYNTSTEEVISIPSARSIPNAASNYIIFRNPEVVPEKALVSTYHYTRNKSHTATYTALIPVRTGRADTLFDTWIVVYKKEYFAVSLPDSVLGRKEGAFYGWCRDLVDNFPYDSVVFYDRSKLNRRDVLEKTNYPIQAEAILMEPVFVSLSAYAGSERNSYLGIFALVTLFFWAATTIKTSKNY